MQALVFYIIYPFIWLISLLPFRMLYTLSDMSYLLIYHVLGYRKKVVFENLNLVFPEKTRDEKKEIASKFYQHLCDILFESLKSISISKKEIKKRFVPLNPEIINAIEQENQSTIVMLGHYASWEWTYVIQLFTNAKGFGIYKRLKNKHFDKLVRDIRAKFGTELIHTKETVPKLIRSRAKGEISLSGFIADQSPKIQKNQYWSSFMGHEVPVFVGAETLAKKLNYAVSYCRIEKVKRGYYTATFEIITRNPKELDNFEITEDFLRRLESQIKEAPEYYLWTHKRWKHRRT
ncbi:lysophospholipid acyltransferase family protein [Psychroflexus montanilacus]|uniref:lysophospholipid acyltransferase family protein n=1 Tax=Psychroflexus montanilacus TaxID=2873598 RepID=UPI001CC9C98B|nr:lysophospholipid acyltransferase family protein [Psychroflexus montanilacus]MBZ9650829.1 lysophospholipid acyltransferase family protein [Psychroflexus montanilacus]